MNLFGVLKETVTPALRLKTALFVSETPEKTQKALDALFPTVTGGLLKRASTEAGLSHVYRTLQKPEFDKNLIETFPQLIESPDRLSQLAVYGNGLVSQLLPDKKSSIANMISSYAKVRNSSATNLLGLATPLVLSALRREMTNRNLDVQGLGSLLADHREPWLNSLPEGIHDKLFEVLGIDDWHGMDAALRNSGVAVQRRATAAAAAAVKVPPTKAATPPPVVVDEEEEETSGVNWGRWLVPLVVVAVIGGGAYWYLNRPEPETTELDPLASATPPPVTDTLARADTSTSRPAVAPTLSDSVKAIPTPLTPMGAPEFVAQMDSYLKDAKAVSGRTFTLDKITFADGNFIPTPESLPAIEALGKLLKDHPRLQLKLVGYVAADSVDARKLSNKRANAIKTRLLALGIDNLRLDASGLGTAAGKTQVDAQVIHR
ncbi:MAG: DUF937 domain-containing protein [Sphingobacteriaceae bacterium]|nr:DUF937 domain-containing protein [Cytophagaceae bacterium]